MGGSSRGRYLKIGDAASLGNAVVGGRSREPEGAANRCRRVSLHRDARSGIWRIGWRPEREPTSPTSRELSGQQMGYNRILTGVEEAYREAGLRLYFRTFKDGSAANEGAQRSSFPRAASWWVAFRGTYSTGSARLPLLMC